MPVILENQANYGAHSSHISNGTSQIVVDYTPSGSSAYQTANIKTKMKREVNR